MSVEFTQEVSDRLQSATPISDGNGAAIIVVGGIAVVDKVWSTPTE
jgi:hypothetical protein